MRRSFSLLLFTMIGFTARAESTVIDYMSRIGEIYVVVACIAVIFLGIVFYLVSLDQKLTKLEQHIKDEQ